MINSVGINKVAFRASSAVQNNVTSPIDNKPKGTDAEFYVDKKASQAIKSYNFVADPAQITKPISFDDYVSKLKAGGLKEGKDFDCAKTNSGAYVFLTRGGNKIYRAINWYGGTNKENFSGYMNMFYPIGNTDVEKATVSYDENCQPEEVITKYKNPERHKNLIPTGLDINSNPKEFILNLKKNGVNYEIERSTTFKETCTMVVEYDKYGNPVRRTDFVEGDDYKTVARYYNPNKDGILTDSVHLIMENGKYEMVVSNYVKDLGLQENVKY